MEVAHAIVAQRIKWADFGVMWEVPPWVQGGNLLLGIYVPGSSSNNMNDWEMKDAIEK